MPRPSYSDVGPTSTTSDYLRRKLQGLTEELLAEELPEEFPTEWDERWSTVRTAKAAKEPLKYLQLQRWMEEERGDYDGPARWVLDRIHNTPA